MSGLIFSIKHVSSCILLMEADMRFTYSPRGAIRFAGIGCCLAILACLLAGCGSTGTTSQTTTTQTSAQTQSNAPPSSAPQPQTPSSNPPQPAPVQSRQFLYVAGPGNSPTISGFAINSDGSLAALGVLAKASSPVQWAGPLIADGKGHLLLYGDNILTFTVQQDGTLLQTASAPSPPGNGARLAMDSAGTLLFLLSRVPGDFGAVYSVSPAGSLTQLNRLTSPPYFYAVAVSPDKRFLYASTWEQQDPTGSLSQFSLDSISGSLTLVAKQTANTSGGLVIDPTGQFLYESNVGVDVYSVDATTGSLALIQRAPARFPSAVAPLTEDLVLSSDGTSVFQTQHLDPTPTGFRSRVVVFSRDQVTGLLTPPSSSLELPGNLDGIVLDATGQFIYLRFSTWISVVSVDASRKLTHLADISIPDWSVNIGGKYLAVSRPQAP